MLLVIPGVLDSQTLSQVHSLLDKGQFIRLTKGKTNRQYVRELGSRWPLRRLLEHTMVLFEEVFFGHHSIGRTQFESCWLRLDEFEALVGQGAVGRG